MDSNAPNAHYPTDNTYIVGVYGWSDEFWAKVGTTEFTTDAIDRERTYKMKFVEHPMLCHLAIWCPCPFPQEEWSERNPEQIILSDVRFNVAVDTFEEDSDIETAVSRAREMILSYGPHGHERDSSEFLPETRGPVRYFLSQKDWDVREQRQRARVEARRARATASPQIGFSRRIARVCPGAPVKLRVTDDTFTVHEDSNVMRELFPEN